MILYNLSESINNHNKSVNDMIYSIKRKYI